ERNCSEKKPTCDPSGLKKKLPDKLKGPFEAALSRRLAEKDLPSEVALVTVKNKPQLHLLRYKLPLPPGEELPEKLVGMLRSQKRLGEPSYPLTFARLVELIGAEEKMLKKGLAHPTFKQAVLLTAKGKKGLPEGPVALAEDRELLLRSPLLIKTC